MKFDLIRLRILNRRSFPALLLLQIPMFVVADWRSDAEERIDSHRKADFTVSVTDATGNPIEGAVVNLEMTRHAFNFGTAVSGARLLIDDQDAATYRQSILDHFNTIVFENGHKWRFWEREGAFDLEIYGEDTGSAETFTNTSGNITDRSRTDNVVAWGGTRIHNDGTKIRTPNLKPLLEEILTRPDWSPGNDMAFLFPHGIGNWSFHSFEGRRRDMAQFVVHLSDGSVKRWALRFGSDDAEEDSISFETNLDSNDLDLGRDSVGIRFAGIDLENPELIESAFIEFTADSDALSGEVTRSATDWAFQNDLEIRLHALMWARSDGAFLPADVLNAIRSGTGSDRTYVRNRIGEHFEDLGNYHHEIVRWWDVLNEQPHEHIVTDFLNPDDPPTGASEIPLWFQKARTLAGETASLGLNDFDLITSAEGAPENRNRNLSIVDTIRDGGGDVDVIGMQGHFFNKSRRSSPESMYAVFEQFAAENLRIEITEFDYWGNFTPSEAAAMTEELYLVAFSHPHVESIMQWGFWDGQHWQDSGVMFERDWELKPAGEAYQQLVTGKWWTDTSAEPEDQRLTDAGGRYSHRAFKGEYWIRAKHAGREVALHSFSNEPRTFSLQLPERGKRVLVQSLRRFDDAAYSDETVSLLGETLPIDEETKIGLRFRDIPVPAGARLSAAHLHLHPSAASVGSTELEIAVENDAGAQPYTNRAEDFAGRVMTTATSTWSLDSLSGNDWILSPDLSGIFPEIGSRPTVNLALQLSAISGMIEVTSFDGDPAFAPVLELRYESWSVDDFLPEPSDPGGSWTNTHFMGAWYIDKSVFPFAYHESAGWLYIQPMGPASAWFFDFEEEVWWYTSEVVFPWRLVFDPQQDEFFWLPQGGG